MNLHRELTLLEDRAYLLGYEIEGLEKADETEITYEIWKAKKKEYRKISRRIAEIQEELKGEDENAND